MNNQRPLAISLAPCAVSDLAAVPPILSAKDGPPAAVAALVGVIGVIGVLALAATIGIA